jgi:hypothetical protein
VRRMGRGPGRAIQFSWYRSQFTAETQSARRWRGGLHIFSLRKLCVLCDSAVNCSYIQSLCFLELNGPFKFEIAPSYCKLEMPDLPPPTLMLGP